MYFFKYLNNTFAIMSINEQQLNFVDDTYCYLLFQVC